MQNAALAALGLNWRYLAFEVQPERLAAAIEGAKVMGFIGLNLTVPHKLLALNMLDALDEGARVWGAVNTVVFEGKQHDGSWRPLREFTEAPPAVRSHGFNTDADAITLALRRDLGFEISGKSILLLGAGGAGRTAALKLAADGAGELFLVNRTAAKAQQIAQEIRLRWPNVRVHFDYPSRNVDLVLNATSLGLKAADPLPFDERQLSLHQVGAVYDMIYRPAETPLLLLAKKTGRPASNGLGMLLYQGAAALELWTDRTAPIDLMRHALEKNVYNL
jgi:shikimate dehydrogenase